jgi:multiple sugar transport system substrate-binding protein
MVRGKEYRGMSADERIGGYRRISRREFLGLGAAGTGLLLLAGCGGGETGGGGPVTLNTLFMKQAAYSETDVKNMTEQFQKQNPNIKVNLTFVAYEALHDKIVAAAPAGTYDTVLVDVIWPAEFASKKMIVDITSRFPESERSEIFDGALKTTEYQGHYYGVPWILDTKYFYYNKKMLGEAGVNPPPDTWDGVVEAARALKSQGVVEYPLIWSWAQAEAIICDYATLLGAYGGQFFDEGGKPAFNTGGGLQALEFMRMTLDEKLSNPASTETLEDDARRIISQGEAAMALNWTYMFALANDPNESQVAGQIEIAHTPQGPAGAPGVNGSMGMAISNGSQNQDEAWKFIEFMTSQKVQDQYAKLSLPIWKSSYEEKKVVDALPQVVPVAKEQLNDMILRPIVPQYNDVSHTLQVEMQLALTGKKTPKQALDDAAKSVESATQGY